MKVLVVSNLYPPHYLGGYELRCAQIVDHLRTIGHNVLVVTSFAQVVPAEAGDGLRGTVPDGDPSVQRWLRYHTLDPLPGKRPRSLVMARDQLREARRFNRLLADWRPDVVSWWNLEGVTKTLLPLPAAHGIPDVHWVEDLWLIREFGVSGETESMGWFDFWRGAGGPRVLRPALKAVLFAWEQRVRREGIATRPFGHRPRHVCFVSEFMRGEHERAGLTWDSSSVIHGGVAADRFYVRRTAADFAEGPLRLLFAGFIEPNRGLQTIVAALGLLPQALRDKVRLTVAQTGPPVPTRFVKEIEANIVRLGLGGIVSFIGKVPHSEMRNVYGAQHALVSATTRAEGLPMAMMEAMCAGCAVVTTGSGGAMEIANAAGLPLFPKEDPAALSQLIGRLVTDRPWVFAVAKRGQDAVLERFSLLGTAEAFSATLEGFAGEAHPRGKRHVRRWRTRLPFYSLSRR